ncbi:MAG: FTR1 family protein [Gemmatimonadota bacterium]
MLSPFVIVLREGFEAFLIVAIVLSYLRKSRRDALIPVVHAAIVTSLLASAGLGWLLYRGANTPLWEGVMGLVAVPFVVGLVVHMWRAGPTLKRRMEARLERSSQRTSLWAAVGVFVFTALMITREGMETALMLFQVRGPGALPGMLLGLAGAGSMAWAWSRWGHLINVRRFFQVTGIFLLIFVVQIAIYSLHELSEAGVWVNDAVQRFHMLTEPYSPYGQYGRWIPLLMVGVPALWLLVGFLRDRFGHELSGAADG